MSTPPPQPTLTTRRLLLRPLGFGDAPQVQRLAGDPDIASTTVNIPHPYEDGMAEAWIATLGGGYLRNENITFGMTLQETGDLVGVVGLRLVLGDARAEMGYWVGKPFWGSGYCTEAAKAVIDYGFSSRGLNRIFAHHMLRNPASGRVMLKIGMQHEGVLRQHHLKWGVYEDVGIYGLLREEWEKRADG
jgi:ribosomal-protein-alanine N-acetyltransferase